MNHSRLRWNIRFSKNNEAREFSFAQKICKELLCRFVTSTQLVSGKIPILNRLFFQQKKKFEKTTLMSKSFHVLRKNPRKKIENS